MYYSLFKFWVTELQNKLMLSMAGFWGEVWGDADLPWDHFAPPLKSHAPPLGKVLMIDLTENLTFFGRKFINFLPNELINLRKGIGAIFYQHFYCIDSNKIFQKKLCSNCNEGQNWMSCTVIVTQYMHMAHRWCWPVLSPNFSWGSWAKPLHVP
jgi:hypothetical protein